MAPRNHSNRKERSSGASLFLRLAQSASIEVVLEDLTEIAAEKGIHLYSVRVKRGRLEREFKPPNTVAIAGRIGELAVGVEGGQTHLVVRFFEPMDGAVEYELEYAAHLAAHRIEVLAGGGLSTDGAVKGSADRPVVIDELIGESELMREVRKNIVIAASLDLSVLISGYPIRTPSLRERPTDIPILIRHYFPSIELEEEALELLCHYAWPGNVRQLTSAVERLSAKAGGRIITTDQVRREMDLERKLVLAPGHVERFPALREGETLIENICRVLLAVYEIERTRLGSHSAAAYRLGMHRNTLYDWLEWARRHVAKSTTAPNR